ncbi:MAG: glycine dehydrogenase, partial [Candidatus Eremiobacteraeota bacterium]|nr:glycine dehydrogenase [Candidatus Eremiobacteraeota bacterium]
MYAPHTQRDVDEMLQTIGIGSLDELLRVPESVALKAKLDVVPALPEYLIQRRFAQFAQKNAGVNYRSFLGGGAYSHYRPPAIAALAMRGEFLTAYTPYQAEVSQGYLQAIYEWQTYICLLTGMELANASVYDGATALAEAAIMALGATARHKILISRTVHPNYRAVLRTYCDG